MTSSSALRHLTDSSFESYLADLIHTHGDPVTGKQPGVDSDNASALITQESTTLDSPPQPRPHKDLDGLLTKRGPFDQQSLRGVNVHTSASIIPSNHSILGQPRRVTPYSNEFPSKSRTSTQVTTIRHQKSAAGQLKEAAARPKAQNATLKLKIVKMSRASKAAIPEMLSFLAPSSAYEPYGEDVLFSKSRNSSHDFLLIVAHVCYTLQIEPEGIENAINMLIQEGRQHRLPHSEAFVTQMIQARELRQAQEKERKKEKELEGWGDETGEDGDSDNDSLESVDMLMTLADQRRAQGVLFRTRMPGMSNEEVFWRILPPALHGAKIVLVVGNERITVREATEFKGERIVTLGSEREAKTAAEEKYIEGVLAAEKERLIARIEQWEASQEKKD